MIDLKTFFDKLKEGVNKLLFYLKALPKIFKHWRKILQLLDQKERKIFLSLFVLFFLSFSFLSINFYFKNTETMPAEGSKYTEGVIGQPRFINPVLGTSDVDRDLIEIIFSGLMKYNENGEIVPDLADNFKIEDEGKTYRFYLKNDIYWHDKKRLEIDDIIFTIETIKDPAYKSPQRANWLGIKIERAGENEIIFRLKNPYAGFLERLTLGIIPKHIWENVPVENFPLSIYNLKPVGSGPYQFQDLKSESEKINSLTLKRFSNYFNKPAYISQLSFKFLKEGELFQSAKKGEIQGFSPQYSNIKTSDIFNARGLDFQNFSLQWPRYFALFFNEKESKLLEEKKIRQALNYATDKTEIIENVLAGEGRTIDSPILPKIYGFSSPSKVYEFNKNMAEDLLKEAGLKKQENKWFKVEEEKFIEFKRKLKLKSKGDEIKRLQSCLAKDPEVYPDAEITSYFGSLTEKAVIKFQEKYHEEILDPWGFKKGTGIVAKTTRAKLNEICQKLAEPIPLKFTLVTAENSLLKNTAEIIKKQWESIGIEVEVKSFPVLKLEKDYIKPRNYEILLFGEVLESIPDPFPFWHSSQEKDPGLNLSLYQNKKADKLLEQARITLDPESRAEKYQKFQNILIEDAPAIFLYSPNYTYWISPEIKGINLKMITSPSKRFSGIKNWYVKTKRALK